MENLIRKHFDIKDNYVVRYKEVSPTMFRINVLLPKKSTESTVITYQNIKSYYVKIKDDFVEDLTQ